MDHEDRIAKLEAKADALEHALGYLMAKLIIKDHARIGASEARGDVQEITGKMLQNLSTRLVGLELKSLDEYVGNILDSERMSE
ncbi:MAG: hypothetical protein OXU70_09320 [Gammaproteobacteria bacterium]|nr:hypothetical protein [Gammaproteobacteria bacterium]